MYLAPEVLSGTFSKACDIFSLGVTLLELATDMDLPNGGHLWHDLRSRGPDPSLTMELQPELRRVIQLMMTRDPDRRPGVKQLLELPCVKDAVRKRSWQLLLSRSQDLLLRLALVFVPLLSLLYSLLSSLALPVKHLLSHLHSQDTPLLMTRIYIMLTARQEYYYPGTNHAMVPVLTVRG